MEIPEKIRSASQSLKSNNRVNRLTVRDFLRHFGVERRGATKVEEIKKILESLDLKTEPDFETAWIDEPIWLRLASGQVEVSTADKAKRDNDCDNYSNENVLESTPSAVRQADEQSELAPTSTEPDTFEATADPDFSDPTFRIGSLPAANKPLVAVNQDDEIARAITLMMHRDFSQLPVMQGEREVKGVISWKSIGMRLAHGLECTHVAQCQEDARIVDANRTLFDVIPTIVEYGYVLVRQRDKKITGVVTSSDLSLQFQALAEPFLLLREIELHIRRLLDGKILEDDFLLLDNIGGSKKLPRHVSDLTFGHYVRLLENPQIWKKLNLKVDAKELTKILEQVRNVRNDVMHFDPDPMTSDELDTLKGAVRFLQQLFDLVPLGKDRNQQLHRIK